MVNQPIIPVVKKQLMGPVGFSNLPNQVHRRSLKRGFFFNLMVVGESGLGKSTLMNTLFNTQLYPEKEERNPSAETPKTVDIQAISADIEENGVKLRLTIIDTPGFGDYVNNEDSWKPILQAIESRYDSFLEQEQRVNRKKMVDNRIHSCLYFIAPTGHCLKPLDVEFMKRLHLRVNLVPVIAKSDTLTDEEIKLFKQRILEDIEFHKIQIYKPIIYEGDDSETVTESKAIIDRIPFAVVGSTQEFDNNSKKVRGRKYPWGVIEVDNDDHCDFTSLRQMLVRTHMEELREHTNLVLYENYRTQKLQSSSDSVTATPFTKIEEERRAHEAKMAKMEQEMRLVFSQKVAEKEAKLKQSEDELYGKHKEMKDQLERQRAELENRKNMLMGASTTSSTPEAKKKKLGGLFKN